MFGDIHQSTELDVHFKEEASTVLAAMGLTVSDAFRILLNRIAHEKALPFEPLVPNETTTPDWLSWMEFQHLGGNRMDDHIR